MWTNRAVVMLGLLLLMPLACLPDPAPPPTVSEGSHIPAITAERLQACMSEYGEQLDGQSYGVQATVQVDQDRRVVDVTLGGVPATAPDLAACARIALRDMAVPEWILRVRLAEPLVAQKQTPAGRGMMGNVLVLGGAIALGEMIAKAFGATLIFAVAVELVHTGVKAATEYEKARRDCNEKLTECLLTDLADKKDEDLHGTSRCAACASACMKQKYGWKSYVEVGDKKLSCEYWKPSWKRESNG